MMRRLAALFILCCACSSLTGGQTAARYATADAYADAAPLQAEKSVPALAAYLKRAGSDDLTRTRALYRWVAQHIAYDVTSLRTPNSSDVTAEGVLRTRQSVCEGYARLTAALGAAMGLEVEIVAGWSKGYGTGSVPRLDAHADHAWNAVRIDGQWRLMDPTWGAGYVDERRQFVRRFLDYYFLPTPDAFVFDHLPKDDRWQLLAHPVSEPEFVDMVNLQPMFFVAGLRIQSHPQENIRADDHLTVTLAVTQPVQMMAQLLDPTTLRPLSGEFAFVQVNDVRAEAHAAFPRAGEYVLRLFAKPRSAAGALQWVLDYRVHASRGVSAAEFPLAYAGFGAAGAWLQEPLTAALKPGRTYHFQIRVPGAINVAVFSGRVWTHLVRNGDDFSGAVPAGSGDNIVFAKYDAASEFVGILKYAGH